MNDSTETRVRQLESAADRMNTRWTSAVDQLVGACEMYRATKPKTAAMDALLAKMDRRAARTGIAYQRLRQARDNARAASKAARS